MHCITYIIGQDGREIFNTMTISQDDKDKIERLFKKLKDYCAHVKISRCGVINSTRDSKVKLKQ